MKRFRLPVFTSVTMLTLVACGGRDPVADEANAVAPTTEVATANVSTPVTGGPPAVTNEAMESASRIPPPLQGRWGLTPADCTSTRGDAKGLLVISANDLKFYESRAVPGSSVEADADSISGNWNFTGEGQSWTRYVSLKLEGNGLVRTERNPVASYTYAKC